MENNNINMNEEVINETETVNEDITTTASPEKTYTAAEGFMLVVIGSIVGATTEIVVHKAAPAAVRKVKGFATGISEKRKEKKETKKEEVVVETVKKETTK